MSWSCYKQHLRIISMFWIIFFSENLYDVVGFPITLTRPVKRYVCVELKMIQLDWKNWQKFFNEEVFTSIFHQVIKIPNNLTFKMQLSFLAYFSWFIVDKPIHFNFYLFWGQFCFSGPKGIIFKFQIYQMECEIWLIEIPSKLFPYFKSDPRAQEIMKTLIVLTVWEVKNS